MKKRGISTIPKEKKKKIHETYRLKTANFLRNEKFDSIRNYWFEKNHLIIIITRKIRLFFFFYYYFFFLLQVPLNFLLSLSVYSPFVIRNPFFFLRFNCTQHMIPGLRPFRILPTCVFNNNDDNNGNEG